MGINYTGKTIQYTSGLKKPRRNPCSYPLIFTLGILTFDIYVKRENWKRKKNVLSSEISETETPKNEKLWKIVTGKKISHCTIVLKRDLPFFRTSLHT